MVPTEEEHVCKAPRGQEDTADPLFTLGVVADVQYADKDTEAAQSDPSRLKRYRESPNKLAAAIELFNSVKPPLRCVLTLGDIIDGNETEELTVQDFQVIRNKLANLEVAEVYHCIGNHCLTLPRQHILQGLGMSRAYYDVELHPGWRMIVLDSMDLSLSWPEGSPQHQETAEFLKDHPFGSESEPQMQTWNGGVGKEQLDWLVKKLEAADCTGEHVLLALHHPVAPGSAPSGLLVWNFEELMKTITEHRSVKLVMCGHYHPGGYAQSDGVHFVTLEGMVEAPEDSFAHALIQFYPERIQIQGHGYVTPRNLGIAGVEA